ncbi:gp127L [Rabbit fibroma virus]|uniref:Deoxyribodipyrimidine photo-lyase n=1 Tax=Rabbit fibroma virus (strain Kasza) TaxID=10272 RepID=Q9Q8V1_RFVKA|nr:gp127L [Rabbit fibroma virus]AAF18010.1 gp127L [Rabbit fibroma virus]
MNVIRSRTLNIYEEQLTSSVVYWMYREHRIRDNWGLYYAQQKALRYRVPLYVCVCLTPFHLTTSRHMAFLLEGLREVEDECVKRSFGFVLRYGCPKDVLPEEVKKHNARWIFVDFYPLRYPEKDISDVVTALRDVATIIQVDSHNIVPCWIASLKQEYSARTFRLKIQKLLTTYLTKFPSVIKHPYPVQDVYVEDFTPTLDDVSPIRGITAGNKGGMRKLRAFLKHKLRYYHEFKNDPTVDACSGLSPWLRYGHLSAQRVVLETVAYTSTYPESVATFLDEIVVRRELSDNFCYYNKLYDSITSTHPWALRTLDDHRQDLRPYLYDTSSLEHARTHDPLWNTAQLQMINEGKMHGYLRMYWAKKILEWSKTPESALSVCIYLNDKYELDGTDPNGYVGCLWAVAGLHDRAWKERTVFGKIRYMKFETTEKKFNAIKLYKMYATRL